MKRYQRSLELWKQAQQYLAPGCSTLSKDPRLYTLGAFPIYLNEGNGVIVKDVDENTYIDFQGSLGANILGIAYPAVDNVVKKQLQKGTLFSLASPLQIELARKLQLIIPGAERIRILKNGSDATSSVVRIARAYTQRTKILSTHFHGWHDWFYVTTKQNRGIPSMLKRDIIEFAYNNLKQVERLFAENPGQIAAIILEPVHLDMPQDNFLQKLKDLAHKNGALLIFDEVITGFRFGLGGAQQYFKVTPDLCCFAKALANGFPLSAVGGKAEIMNATSDVDSSMTYGEETLSVAASLATIKEIEEKPVVEKIWELGKIFQDGYNDLAKKYNIPTKCIGFPCRLQLNFSNYQGNERKTVKGYFMQESAKQGVLLGNTIFMTYTHEKKHIHIALKICEKIFRQLQKIKGTLPLQGEVPIELW